ncbi:MAG: transketolase [Deltaproteobacteria bacterium]|jgi:transketolase|nr:transketolase [Deltaproteobacteria bacterium]
MPTAKELANALRFLSMDAVERAQSGHPGACLGMADMAEVLWNGFLKHNPASPGWSNRDRFVLSNGHASMLLYALLHLSGYGLSLEEIKNFRQLHGKTPGHPEYGLTPGVEATSGPLGQGLAMAVGMALAERLLAAEFNREGFALVDHHTYVFLGDGCLMEGLSHEAASLAGVLGLGKLIAFWDNNEISIDGQVRPWFADNTPARFAAYGWQVISPLDGHDPSALKRAIARARRVTDRPSLLCCRTLIGQGAPTKAGSASCHGAPLGEAEVAATRKILNWHFAPFEIPAKIRKAWDARKRGARAEKSWQDLFAAYSAAHPALAEEYRRRVQNSALPANWEKPLGEYMAAAQKEGRLEASRISSKKILDLLGPALPELVGGAADLTSSVGARWENSPAVARENPGGRHIFYGVREFCMGAMMNGLALHGGFIPYGGTFLVFVDYAKAALRLTALMKQRVIWLLSHDSIQVGEDGPTHQPVEQLGMLRLTPGVHVWRPCDAVETAAAWQAALARNNGPSCLILSRQSLPTLPRDAAALAGVRRGGYILRESRGGPEIILLATGSETSLALQAAEILEKRGRAVRVVSLPCAELFEEQDRAWKEQVLPHAVRARVAVEASSADWWRKYVGSDGGVLGMNAFGASGPGKPVYEHFGFTVDAVLSQVKETCLRCGV